MKLLQRLRNLWKLSELDFNYETKSFDWKNYDGDFNIVPKQKMATIIKMNDPIKEVLKYE